MPIVVSRCVDSCGQTHKIKSLSFGALFDSCTVGRSVACSNRPPVHLIACPGSIPMLTSSVSCCCALSSPTTCCIIFLCPSCCRHRYDGSLLRSLTGLLSSWLPSAVSLNCTVVPPMAPIVVDSFSAAPVVIIATCCGSFSPDNPRTLVR